MSGDRGGFVAIQPIVEDAMSKVKNFMSYRQQDDLAAREDLSVETSTFNEEPSKTVQGPAVEADINFIAKTFGLGPSSRLPLPPEALDPSYYGDLREAPADLQSAMNLVMDAQEKFSALPAELRAKFNHSPAAMWEWIHDARNHEEAVKLGILRALDPVPVPPAPDPAGETPGA